MKTPYPLKLRVSMACLYLKLNDFIAFLRIVVTMLTGNPNYTTTKPTLTEITAGLDDLEAKASAAAGGDKNARITRNMAWEGCVMQARDLINYVQLNGQNNPAILTSSGFHLTKTGSPVGPLSAPQKLRVSYRSPKSGEARLLMDPVAGVTAGYCLQQATSLTGPWVEIANTANTRNTVEGLTPGTTYSFRACANGTDGPSAWSTVLTLVAI